MQFARIGTLNLHYQLIGAPAGKPVIVFANSLGTDFRIWRDVIVRLAGDFAIVTYDMRGHGLSDSGGPHSTMDDHVGDLAGLLDMLDARRVIVCGLSVGGLVAQGLLAARPELVRALVLCDTAHKIGTDALWNGRIDAVRSKGIEAIADATLERWFTPAFRAADNAAFAGYRNMLIRQPVEGYVATCEAIRDADFTEAAGRIAVPAICIVGDQDGATPPDVVLSTAKLIPGCRYEVIRDAGHIPCVEQPEVLAEIIRAFVSEIGLAHSTGR